MNVTIANLEKFSLSEIKEASELMLAYAEGNYSDSFFDTGVTIEFNQNSGHIFLINSEYQVLMFNEDGDLKMWYYLSYAGSEGFIEDLIQEYDEGTIDEEDYEQLAEILEENEMFEKAKEVGNCL